MKPTLVIDPEAKSEFDEAYDFYQNRKIGLGDEFAGAIKTAIRGILALPKRHPVVLREIRRGRVIRFPFAIYYRIENSTIRIVSIFHTSRDPKNWQSRA